MPDATAAPNLLPPPPHPSAPPAQPPSPNPLPRHLKSKGNLKKWFGIWIFFFFYMTLFLTRTPPTSAAPLTPPFPNAPGATSRLPHSPLAGARVELGFLRVTVSDGFGSLLFYSPADSLHVLRDFCVLRAQRPSASMVHHPTARGKAALGLPFQGPCGTRSPILLLAWGGQFAGHGGPSPLGL